MKPIPAFAGLATSITINPKIRPMTIAISVEKNAEKPSDKKEKAKEQGNDVEVDRILVMQDEEIFIDNEKETIVEEPNEVGDTPLDLPENYIYERADNSNEIESSPIGFKALLLKIWKFIKILFWIIIGI